MWLILRIPDLRIQPQIIDSHTAVPVLYMLQSGQGERPTLIYQQATAAASIMLDISNREGT